MAFAQFRSMTMGPLFQKRSIVIRCGNLRNGINYIYAIEEGASCPIILGRFCVPSAMPAASSNKI